MKLFACCLLLLVSVSSVVSVRFEPCSTNSDVSSVSIDDCSVDEIFCNVAYGSGMTVTIEFKSEIDSDTAIVKASLDSRVIYTMPDQPDACQSGVECPIKKGESYTYTGTFQISADLPKGFSTFKIDIADKDMNGIVCISAFVYIDKFLNV